MGLPPELHPTETTSVALPSGVIVELPTCRPAFLPWKGKPVNFDFGNKPLLNCDGEACFAELVILRTLIKDGWDGVWVESYGGVHYLRTMPNGWDMKSAHVTIPTEKEKLLKEIWATAGTKACFDIFAWKDGQVLLCEAKRTRKDRLTKAQLRFIEGALTFGVALTSLLIVEWSEMLA